MSVIIKQRLKPWIFVVAASGAALCIAFCAVVYLLQPDLPSFDSVRAKYKSSELQLQDRNGALLRSVRIDNKRRRLNWTKLGDTSQVLVQALFKSEDKRYFSHPGVDPLALASAAWGRTFYSSHRGASTISMQVAAQLLPGLKSAGNRGFFNKLSQIFAAIKLERTWSKDEILEAYLNMLGFRGELQGIAAASQGIFGRAPNALDSGQAMLLAALVPAPAAKKEQVAARACRLAHILEQSNCAAINSNAALLDKAYEIRSVKLAPHLARSFATKKQAVVSTTLSREVQEAAIEALTAQLTELRSKNVFDGAMLVVDNASGDVLAYVGNISELSSSKYIDGVKSYRQAGSTLKPSLYAAAFDQNILRPDTLLDDSPLEIGLGYGNYQPENYDHQFRGPVTVSSALASSLNIPAVRTLKLVGLENFGIKLSELGFSKSSNAKHYGYSLALGTSQISLFELVNAYRTLANHGNFTALRTELNTSTPQPRQVYSSKAAKKVTQIMADREARSMTFGLESVLATPFWSAVKTGTSKDMVDNWCVGFSKRYTVGVWVGNSSGAPIWNVSGLSGAAPAWLQIMSWLHTRDHISEEEDAKPQVIISDPSLAVHFTQITYPVDGSIFAIDPDIPIQNQKIFFEADSKQPNLLWRLDREILGPAELSLWEPRPGKHLLQLEAPDGAVVDRVAFIVKR